VGLLTKNAQFGEFFFGTGHYQPQDIMVRNFSFGGIAMDQKIGREKRAALNPPPTGGGPVLPGGMTKAPNKNTSGPSPVQISKLTKMASTPEERLAYTTQQGKSYMGGNIRYCSPGQQIPTDSRDASTFSRTFWLTSPER
jgi:hypothetical protein